MLEQQLLESWQIHVRINLYLLEAIDPAAFAAPAGVDLGFDNGKIGARLLSDLRVCGSGFFYRSGYNAFLNGNAVALEQFFSLVFV